MILDLPIDQLVHAVIALVLVVAIAILRVMLNDVRKLHRLEEDRRAEAEPDTEA